MNTLSKLLLPSLFIAMMFSFNNSSQAQIINENSTNVTDVDPIAATLDSLVNLTYVQRLNLNSTAPANNSFKSFEIPAYSADIYKKRIEKLVSLFICFVFIFSLHTHIRKNACHQDYDCTCNQQVNTIAFFYFIFKQGISKPYIHSKNVCQ